MKLRIRGEKERNGYLVRMWWGWSEVAYLVLALRGVRAEVEFPSDWRESSRVWFRFSPGFFELCFSLPWPWTVPDDHQCSGPRYGFGFFADALTIFYGKSHGKRDDPRKTFWMPWSWRHREHKILSEPETHAYTYTLRSGEVQQRKATIKAESRLWTRPWIPHRRLSRSIDVTFDDEVGERSGSWKGGCIGCGYEMKPGETPLQTLRRMQVERTF